MMTAKFARVTLPPDAFSQSADAVHPDMVCPPNGWNGGACWLMYTPYKNSDPAWENPGFLVAANDTVWVTPSAIRNPIIAYPGAGSYNSDPDHAFDPATRRLIQIYRVVADTMNRIMLMSTATGKQWTTPVVAFAAHSHDIVSPTMVIENDRTARVWSIRSGVAGCNALSTTLEVRSAHPDLTQSFESAAVERSDVARLLDSRLRPVASRRRRAAVRRIRGAGRGVPARQQLRFERSLPRPQRRWVLLACAPHADLLAQHGRREAAGRLDVVSRDAAL